MNRRPRDPQEPLFDGPLMAWSCIQGGLALAIVAAVYIHAQTSGMREDEVRALTFTTLVLSVIALIFVDRSFSSSLIEAFTRGNRALTAVLLTVFTVMALSLFWPPAAALFRFAPISWTGLGLAATAAACLLVILEGLKAVWTPLHRKRQRASQGPETSS